VHFEKKKVSTFLPNISPSSLEVEEYNTRSQQEEDGIQSWFLPNLLFDLGDGGQM
jgi:hypothetical protein